MSLNTLSFKGFAFTGSPQSAQYVSVRTGPGDEDFANVLLSDLRTYITAEVEVRIAALEAGESGGAKPSIWPVARTMTLSGPVTGSASFDGSQNFSLSTSIADGALTIAKTNGLQGQLTTLQTNIDGKAPLVHSHISTQPNLNSIPGGVLPVGAVVGSGSTALDGFTNPLYLSAYDGQSRASQIVFDNAVDEIGFRRFSAGNWRSIRKIWTEANFDPNVKASTGGNTFTGLNTFANGRVVIRADVAATQPALQLQDESAVLLGMVYYNRSDKAVTLTSIGDGVTKVLSLKQAGLEWDGKKVWHAGNFDPAAYNYMTVMPTLYNASAGINCDNLAVGSKAFVHNANTNSPGTAATYWHIETVQLGDVAGSLIQRAYAADSSEMWTRVYNAGWKAWRRMWTSENFNPVNKLDANAAAASAQKLTVARTIALTGVVSGSVSFDGSANATITTAFTGDVTNNAGGFITSGGALQVNNPNASSASIKMDWNGDMPRLRIGGSGTGSNATFLIVGQSEKTRMSLDSNGNAMFAGNILASGDKTVYHSGNLDLADFTRLSTTNLGKTAATLIDATTLNSAAAWSALPVGFSSWVMNSVGTTNGAPANDYGYFHKFAQRDTQGGWGGIWLSDFAASKTSFDAYIGGAHTSSAMARWAKLWNSSNHGAGSGLDADLLDGKDGGYYLSKDTLLGGANMARNGSFESQYNSGRPYFWNLGGNATGRSGSFVVSAAGPAGVGFRIDATSATAGQYIDMMQPLLEDGTDPRPTCVPNRPYTASCDFRGTEGAMVRMYIQFYDSSDTVIATATSQDFTASATNYQRAFVTGRAPANAVKLRMYCPRLHNNGLGGATVPLFVEYAGASLQEGDSYSTFHYPGSSFLRNDIANLQDVRLATGNGRGLRFFDNEQYKIFMSVATDATYGGRIAGETTSDYNMYFRMSSGTNRGFVFEKDNGNKLLSINPNGVRSAVDITAPIITATTQFQVSNPNNTAARVWMDWLNDNPRIRVGGSGAGAAGTLQFTWPSETVNFSITNAGNADLRGQLSVLKLITKNDQTSLFGDGGASIRGTGTGSVVLSSGTQAGGNIYLRPNGDTVTTGQAVLYTNGQMEMTSAKLGVGVGAGGVMLELAGDRAWQFRQVGTGATSGLELFDVIGGKKFDISTTSSANKVTIDPNISTVYADTFAGTATGAAKWSTARNLYLQNDLVGNVAIDGSADISLNAYSRAYTTGNTGNTYPGQYVRVASITLGALYEDSSVALQFMGYGDSAGTGRYGRVRFRAKQQVALPGLPYVDVSLEAANYLNPDDFVAVIGDTSAYPVKVDLFIKMSGTYSGLKCTVMGRGGSRTTQVLENDGYATALPAGTQVVGVADASRVYAGTFNGALSGNAATATKLATARTINGVAFDGTANITVPATWNGGTVNGAINIFNGTLNAQASHITLAWSGGSTRWAHVMESSGDYAIYGYNASGGAPYQQLILRNTSLAAAADKYRALEVQGGIKSGGANSALIVVDRGNNAAEYHAYVQDNGGSWAIWRQGYDDIFKVAASGKIAQAGVFSAALSTANSPNVSADQASFRAYGNYGGGYGLIDGSYQICMYSISGNLNFGFGSSGNAPSKASLRNDGTFFATDYAINSDASLKENVVELFYNGRLRPVEFDWIDGKKHDLGFIAQEVQKLYPDAVQPDEVTGKLRLSPMKLIAVLSSQVNSLEDRLAQLEALVASKIQ